MKDAFITEMTVKNKHPCKRHATKGIEYIDVTISNFC